MMPKNNWATGVHLLKSTPHLGKFCSLSPSLVMSLENLNGHVCKILQANKFSPASLPLGHPNVSRVSTNSQKMRCQHSFLISPMFSFESLSDLYAGFDHTVIFSTIPGISLSVRVPMLQNCHFAKSIESRGGPSRTCSLFSKFGTLFVTWSQELNSKIRLRIPYKQSTIHFKGLSSQSKPTKIPHPQKYKRKNHGGKRPKTHRTCLRRLRLGLSSRCGKAYAVFVAWICPEV